MSVCRYRPLCAVQFGTSDIHIYTHRVLLNIREFRDNRRGVGRPVLMQGTEITFRREAV